MQASSFRVWLEDIKADAQTVCASSEALQVVSDALADVPDPPIVTEKDLLSPTPDIPLDAEVQAEPKKEGMSKYVSRMACKGRIRIGMEKVVEHRTAIRRIAEAHGVPWQLLMAIWGIETNFGSFMGEHDVVTVLAQEAFQLQGTPLGDYVRSVLHCVMLLSWPTAEGCCRELLAALRLLGEGHVHKGFRGSEAGAVGQCQFMPSNYFKFAQQGSVQGNSDGTDNSMKPDIWNSPQDTLASIASFLRAHGYQKGDSYGTLAVLRAEEEVTVVDDSTPSDRAPLEEDLKERMQCLEMTVGALIPYVPAVGDVRTAGEWAHTGASMMRYSTGSPASQNCKLKLAAMDGKLVLLTTESGQTALFSYNRSLDYVAAVIHLANLLEVETVQTDAATAAANMTLLNKE